MSTSEASPARVVHQDEHCIVGTFRNLAIAVWEDDTRVETLRVLGGLLPRLASQFPGGIGLFQVISERHPPLRSESRAELNRILKAGGAYIRCSTVVFEGQGFRAAAVRGIVAGLVMLTRVPFPHQVFATLPPAMDLQLVNLPASIPRLERTELSQAIGWLRGRMRPRPVERSA